MGLAVVVAAVPLLGVTALVLRLTEERLTETHQELFYAVVDDVASSLGHSYDAVSSVLAGTARILGDHERPIDERLDLARALVGGASEVSSVAVYDQDGEWIDSITVQTEAGAGAPPRLSPSLRARAAERGEARSAVRVAGSPSAQVVVPVRGADKTWYVAGRVGLGAIRQRVSEIASGRLASTGRLLVIDDEFRVLAARDPGRVGDTVSAAEVGALEGLEPGAVDEGLLYFGAFDAERGGKTVGAVQSLRELPWAVVVELPYGVAYRELATIREAIVRIVIAAVVLAALAGVAVAWRMTRPIKRLVEYAGDLAHRRFDRRVQIRTSDELGLLGDALSNAAADLELSDEQLRREAAIRADLGRYLPGQLVEDIVSRRGSLDLGGQRRDITVIFADVAGFTPLVERQEAASVVAILNELFTILTEIIFRHGGTIDKFIGDCVMAFWGAPDPQADHAQRALLAAEDMLRWLEAGNAKWKAEYGVEIELAIGIHTGDAVVGNFGSQSRMAYTAVGDTVNVAARLESLARPGQILISSETRAAAGDEFSYARIGMQRLAGRRSAVELYEVVT